MAEKLQPGKVRGELSAAGFRFGIVVSRFNSFITERLLAAAVDALERAGAASKDVDVVYVPGAFELPLAAKKTDRDGEVRCADRRRLRTPRRDDTLRLCVLGDCSRIAARADGQRPANNILCPDLRHAGAGHRPRRSQGREQRIRSGTRGHRNGATVTKTSRLSFGSGACRKAAAQVTCLSAPNPASLRCKCCSSGT